MTEATITFTAEADVELTAIFAINTYTLTVSVNDESKGTVDVATGIYNYGTEVTLTATPAEGYELLAWSDRSTNKIFTLTITADKAVSAYFVKSYVNEPTFTVEKLWENTNVPASTNNGYQAVGWDGKIYMKDKGVDVINVYTSATESSKYADTDANDDQSIAVDEAGNLILRSGSTNFYASPKQIAIFKKGETIYKTIDFTLPVSGRCDFISASGDIFSEQGGYVYFYCQNTTTVSRLFIKNGGATAEDVVVDALNTTGLTATSNGSQSHVVRNIYGNLLTHARTANPQEVNIVTGEVLLANLPNFKISTLGAASFELAGKEFWAYNVKGTDGSTEWNLYNLTDGVFISDTTLYLVDKAKKNSAANWLNVQVVDEKTAYIYQFCPVGATAVWKVTANFVKPATPVIEVSEEAVMTITCETENAVIYFDYNEEFDGEVAENDENKYEEAIALSTSDDVIYQVEAIAVLDGEVSDVATATFEVKDGAISVDLDAIGALAVVYSNNGQLFVQTEVGTMIEVYSLQGQVLYAGEAAADLTAIDVNEKVVLVRVAGETVKAVIK